MTTALTFSDDQASTYDDISQLLAQSGVNLDDSLLMPPREAGSGVMAVTGKAGSGKTMLLAELYKALEGAGVDVVSGDYESRKRKDRRTLAILAPTTGTPKANPGINTSNKPPIQAQSAGVQRQSPG